MSNFISENILDNDVKQGTRYYTTPKQPDIAVAVTPSRFFVMFGDPIGSVGTSQIQLNEPMTLNDLVLDIFQSYNPDISSVDELDTIHRATTEIVGNGGENKQAVSH